MYYLLSVFFFFFQTYLLQFLNSQLYFKYISECIIIIQTGGSDSELLQKYPGIVLLLLLNYVADYQIMNYVITLNFKLSFSFKPNLKKKNKVYIVLLKELIMEQNLFKCMYSCYIKSTLK